MADCPLHRIGPALTRRPRRTRDDGASAPDIPVRRDDASELADWMGTGSLSRLA